MSSGGARERAIGDERVRRITPRRVWPGGRALLGGLLVTLAALGVFSAYRSADRPPETRYVVATADIAPGTVITTDHVGLQRIELPASIRAQAFDDADDALVLGSVAVAPVEAGELLQASAVRSTTAPTQRPPAYELSFEIDTARALNGDLRPGEVVDVVATSGVGEQSTTRTVVERVLILDVSTPTTSFSAGAVIITVGLDESNDAISVTSALDRGLVTLVRANP